MLTRLSKCVRGFCLVVLLSLLLSNQKTMADALLVHAGVASRANDVKAKIDGTGLYGGTTILFNALAATPDPATLGQHDAVLVWSDGPFADADTLGDNLADYVDQGGTVVTMVFSLVSGSGFEIGGRWRDEGYSPILAGSNNPIVQLTLGTVHEPNDGLMQGVVSFTAGSRTFRSAGSLAPGAALIAEWSDGAPLVAAFDSFSGCVVALNFYPPSSDVDSDYWDAGTDGDILMANALNYHCCVGAGMNDPDSDSDGVPDACDKCPDFDDLADNDNDGVPDGCDMCPGFDDTLDGDNDGIADGCDICPGFDDAADSDGDGVPNGCDTQPVHNLTQGTDFYGLQDAIDAAVNGDVIKADAQTYFESINFLGKAIILRSSSNDPNNTIIDGTGNEHVIRFINSEEPNTVLQGFTVTGGNADVVPNGGGVYNLNSSPTIRYCVFENNRARFFGGGIYNDVNAAPTIEYCVFRNNIASFGGGMCNADSNPVVNHCTFENNQAIEVNQQGGSGGGMLNGGRSPSVSNCTFKHNHAAKDGGGMVNSNGSPRINDCIFEHNVADNEGGGMYNSGSTGNNHPRVTDCIFKSNSAEEGGGLYAGIGTTTINRCIFLSNQATFIGGGIRNKLNLTVNNSLFVANSSGDVGGGIGTVVGIASINNCTLVRNVAGNAGGGMHQNFSSNTVNNSIFWENSDAGGMDASGQIVAINGTLSVRYSNVMGGWGGGGNINADPLFADVDGPDGDIDTLDDNDLRLTAQSPCVDAGNTAAVPVGILSDLDSNFRFVDTLEKADTGIGYPFVVDMGPYEFLTVGGLCVSATQAFGDINCDGIVNFLDYAILAGNWLAQL